MAKREKRRRNAEATQEAIERAARRQFSRKGYDQVGLREIARDADVDAALISRYFGSKQGLFEAAVIPHSNIDTLIEGDIDSFGSRVAAECLDHSARKGQDLDTALAFLLSAGNEEVGPKIANMVGKAVVAPLAERLDGPDRACRAALVLATVLGFDVLYRMARIDVLIEADQDILSDRLAELIQHIASDSEANETKAGASPKNAD